MLQKLSPRRIRIWKETGASSRKLSVTLPSPSHFPDLSFLPLVFLWLIILAVFLILTFYIIKAKFHINILCVLLADCLRQCYSDFKGMKAEMKFYGLNGLTQVCARKPALHFGSHSLMEKVCFAYQALGSSMGSTLWIIFLSLLKAALLAACWNT